MKFKQIKHKIKNNWHFAFVILLALCFFLSVSSYIFVSQRDNFVKWGSPDENANYVFTELYSQTGKISIFNEVSLYSRDIVHPRSLRSDYGEMKPVSFLGIILIYGFLSSLIKYYNIIPYLTPLFASFGIVFFYLFVKRIFGRRNALISSVILASFPVYIYYSARSMFHNVLFVDLLIISAYFFVFALDNITKNTYQDKKNIIVLSLSGLLLGLALITRTSEAIWILPILFIVFLVYIKKIGILNFTFFFSALFLALAPIFYWNTILYGSPINGGYPEMNTSIRGIMCSGNELVNKTVQGNFKKTKELLVQINNIFFHFGLDFSRSWRVFTEYFIKMFYFLFWFAVFGFFLFFSRIRKWDSKQWVYVLSYFILSIILVVYYGSWQFNDNPDVNSFTIGNSYTRYWLPVYLGAMPLFSYFLIRFTRGIFYFKSKNKVRFFSFKVRPKFLVNSLRVVFICIVSFVSVIFVLFGSEEGLMNTLSKTKEAKSAYQQVLNLTEDDAVVITRYYDKIFFPERKVVYGALDDINMNKLYAQISKRAPLYYFTFSLPDDAIDYLNDRRLKESELQIRKVKLIDSNFTLYELVFYKKP